MEFDKAVRLDQYLQKNYPDITRSQLQKLVKSGQVTVNGEVITKNGFALVNEDTVHIELINYIKHSDELSIDVIYEDSECILINKPVGVLTHSKGQFNPEPTVASWLANRPNFMFEDNNSRDGIVHRLDRATSGIMICAKTPIALKHLQKQFHDRKAKKTYVARIEGVLSPKKAIIDVPIERNPKQPQRFRPGKNGKSAQTEYATLKIIEDDSIVELKPRTGRTHQLRVHLAYLKHPIIGDVFYEGKQASRMFLHASELEITLPNRERCSFKVDVPEEFYGKKV